LHDFNTPLTSLKLNLFLLKKECNSPKIEKIEQNIKTILNYQENLKAFLSNNPLQKEKFNIKDIIDEKLRLYSLNYPTISYENRADCVIEINKSAFSSILDNIISNAFKYNKKNGKVEIFLKDKKLYIKDTGIGIKNPKRVFDRFYKEQERGIGIGMNIVKKLTNELGIEVEIKSLNGTEVILDLSKYC
jgi:signal transduction histidine kinase